VDASASRIADIVIVTTPTLAGSGDAYVIIILVSAGETGIIVVNYDEVVAGFLLRIRRD